jgi:hypothetical protein
MNTIVTLIVKVITIVTRRIIVIIDRAAKPNERKFKNLGNIAEKDLFICDFYGTDHLYVVIRKWENETTVIRVGGNYDKFPNHWRVEPVGGESELLVIN